jgi:hypothetical protein
MEVFEMSKKAKALLNLWKMKRINKTSLQKAVEDGIITEEELKLIISK